MASVCRSAIGLAIAAIAVAGPRAPHESRAQAASEQAARPGTYRSPIDLALSPDGRTLYATDHSAGNVSILDTVANAKRGEIGLRGKPTGIALSADGATLYVAEDRAGTVAVIDTSRGEVTTRIPAGKWPVALAVAHGMKRLYVGNKDNHTVSVFDVSQTPARLIKHIPVVREPTCLAVTPDERYVVVANLLAYGPGTDPELSAVVSLIDNETLAPSATVKLPSGSTMVQGLCISPDGKWAYVVHTLGKFHLPITQLRDGWVNTFALSVIDIAKGTRRVTVLLDELTRGAADPHSIVISADGRRLWISHAGVHEVSTVEIGLIHELLDGKLPKALASLKAGALPNIWVRIQKDPKAIVELENHLTALYIADAIRRVPSGGNGPRGLALSANGKKLFVANYFSGQVTVLDADSGRTLDRISLGPQPEPDAIRRGQFVFHDANRAYQRWHSCSTCHANEGHVDGLRWDFMIDGAGNGKDTHSLIRLDKTEPMTWRGLFPSAKERTRAGLASTNMLIPSEADADDLFAYLTSLRPVPSPHLTPEGTLTQAAQRGKALFEDKAGCLRCHPAPYFTDKKMHNVGVTSDSDADDRYDTPSLLEAYRTAPYLHDGRALTIKDIFTGHNERALHGEAHELSDQESDDLVAYVLSL